MRHVHPIPPRANDDPAVPPRSEWYTPIIGRCVAFARLTILVLLLTIIFLAIPTGTPPELGLNPGSPLWSVNISISHPNLITVEYPHVKLLLSFDGQLAFSRPSLVSNFTKGPGCVTSLRARARSTLAIVTDLGVNGLVARLNGGEVTIDVAAKAKRRLRLGPWWAAELNVDVSCRGLSFTAPTDGEGGGEMVFKGVLTCALGIIRQLWSRTTRLRLGVSFLNLHRFLRPRWRGRQRSGQACGPVWLEEVYDENMVRRAPPSSAWPL